MNVLDRGAARFEVREIEVPYAPMATEAPRELVASIAAYRIREARRAAAQRARQHADASILLTEVVRVTSYLGVFLVFWRDEQEVS